MWFFRHKYLADGTLSHYKARLVANGNTQLEGIDVDETFSLVVKPCTIQTVLSLATSQYWSVHQLDVKNAFLHGDLSETVYMHQPPGFRDSAHPDYVCLLQRHVTDTAYLLLYVDDIVLTAFSETLLHQIIASLHQEFFMTDLGSLNYFFGISVTRDSSGMFLSQRKYVAEILEQAHMADCSLQYLTFKRPDISYAVQQVCLYMHDPREPHFSALKRILRYVRGTLDHGLQLFSSSTTSLVAYSDAGLGWLSYYSAIDFSAEAEYRGVANAVAETCWLRNLLRELHTPLSSATLVYCDNVSAVYLSSNMVRVLHVPSRYRYANIFTKGLPSALFEEFRTSLSIRSPPVQTAEEC
ncbi:ribonuclease H-like domain-containing protein [Tanacetum coccineum]